MIRKPLGYVEPGSYEAAMMNEGAPIYFREDWEHEVFSQNEPAQQTMTAE